MSADAGSRSRGGNLAKQTGTEEREEERRGRESETITALLETIRRGQCSGKEGRSFSCRDRNSGPLRFLASYDAARFQKGVDEIPRRSRGERVLRIVWLNDDFGGRRLFANCGYNFVTERGA